MSNLQQIEKLKKAIYKLQEAQEFIISALGESDAEAIALCEDLDSFIQDLEYTIDDLQN